MAIFQHITLVTTNNDIISIRNIESLHFGRDTVDLVIDKLKDDLVFNVTTVSGRTYTISVRHQMTLFKIKSLDVLEIQEAIFDRWMHIAGLYGNSTK